MQRDDHDHGMCRWGTASRTRAVVSKPTVRHDDDPVGPGGVMTVRTKAQRVGEGAETEVGPVPNAIGLVLGCHPGTRRRCPITPMHGQG
jgi:hypothetical protein